MNQCIMTGRIASDIEVKCLPSGTTIANFTLAVDDGFGDKKKTYFPRMVAFAKTAETMGNTLAKGRKIIVDCRFTEEKWEKDGQKRTAAKFIVNTFEYCDSKKQDEVPFGGTEVSEGEW